jgi:creatinine amidohydrolase/Fe(II)-dependent formamide hydrolase-like protein
MTYVARSISIILCLCILSAMPSFAQIYDMREMATVDFSNLDLERTAIIIPGGILEQHGPYLPSYTDGYQNEYWGQRVAESIVKREGWTVLIFPPIPLGAGGANQIAKRHIFPGTYHVHFSTLRAMFMDLASEFGEAGFQWVFVISQHGAQYHLLALDHASDFFADIYGGAMVHLSGLIPDEPVSPQLDLSSQEQMDNGLEVHGGLSETSQILFLRPDLVRPGYQNAEPQSGESMRDLVTRGAEVGWPGYFGAPSLATASRGARIMEARLAELSDLALRILDGFDYRSLQRRSEGRLEDEAVREYNAAALEHAQRIQQVQQEWLERQGLE